MSLAKTFYLLKNAELQAGELYAMIGLSISITQPELADLFNDLAREEELHARQIVLMQSLFLESQESFLQDPETEILIAEFIQKLEGARDYFNRHFAEIKPSDLIDLAMGLERDLVEKHRMFFIKVADPQIKSLLENLNLADLNHIRKLEDFPPG
jgi:rubrerythrin